MTSVATPNHCISTLEESGQASMATDRLNLEIGGRRRLSQLVLSFVLAIVFSLATAAASSADIGIASFSARFVDPETGLPATQAGSHPDLVTDLRLTQEISPATGTALPTGSLKDVIVDLPPGFYGNPTAASECPPADLQNEDVGCPIGAQVGWAEVQVKSDPAQPSLLTEVPVFNMTPEPGDVATFAFEIIGVPAKLGISLRTDGDYGIHTTIENNNEALAIYGSRVTLWGVPADPIHDPQRKKRFYFPGSPAGIPPAPFLTLPPRCDSSLVTSIRVNSWQAPGTWASASDEQPAPTGCDKLAPFRPTLDLQPALKTAGAPSAYDAEVSVPQESTISAPAAPLLRKAVVRLPEGVAVSPSAAQGLTPCSDEQIAPQSKEEPACPSGSKIGTVSIETPVLHKPLEGEVILGTPKPGQLFRLWLVARGSNLLLKLPGIAHPDLDTGRLTTVFDNTPQLPFSTLHLHFKGGSRAVLVNPDTCGTKVTTGEMTPWSGFPAKVSSSFDLSGCSGGFAPRLEAGSENPVAGAFSPFRLRVTREDADESLRKIDLTLPPGQLASLRNIPYCPTATLAGISGDEGAAAAELAQPSCPAASEIGKVTVGAGAGSNPLYVDTGRVYLAGPYKGALLSLAFVTPALAGPFDLGNVVVRSALDIDPVTAQVRAASDPLPTILHGVPLDLRDIRVSLDRPDFTLNPTSCEEMRVAGKVTSTSGTAAPVRSRFQVADCAALGFRPKLSLRLTGPTHRGAHPALRAVLKAREGDANIGKAVVTLPPTEYLENSHLENICTRVRYAADNCPKNSIYGYAKAWSPLLDKPLQGPVYLRSSDHQLPDLVASLDGQIHLDLAGRIDSVNERLRTTFWAVPDAPVSKFVLRMKGGNKSLLVNNRELCQAKPRATVAFTGHNGKHRRSNPLVRTDCGRKRGR